MAEQRRYRPDQNGTHRLAFEHNKRRVFATQKICGICGQPVDFSLKYPHPLSACIDHIVPIDKGGHPSALENLQLAHLSCNRAKWDKLSMAPVETGMKAEPNRDLPQSMDWTTYRA